jgi:hypothetical protein
MKWNLSKSNQTNNIVPNKFFETVFTGEQLSTFLHEKFPEGFSLEIYRAQQTRGQEMVADFRSRVFHESGQYSPEIYGKNEKRNYMLWWPETRHNGIYSRFRPRFEVYSGDENTYVYFMLEDGNDAYLATWGYKRCDVERNYLIEFINELYA